MKSKKNNINFLVVPALMLSVFLGACGSTGTNSKTDTLVKAANKYVTLGDYKGVEVSADKATEDPTDDELNAYIDDTLIKSASAYIADSSKTTVGENDIVNVDYTGLLDGTAFDGGTATNVNLDVAGNCDPTSGTTYIDGFTSGLVGANVGDTIDCPVTFPSNYGAADLAGKDVIFRFTINYIGVPATHDNLTDEYVKTNFNQDTVADFYEYAKTQYKSSQESDYESALRQAVMDTVVNNATISDIPDEVIDFEVERYKKSFMMSNSLESESDMESYLSSNYSMSLSDFEDSIRTSEKENIDKELVFLAVAEKENIKADGEDYDAYLKNLVSSQGVSSEDELYKTYMPKDQIEDYYRISTAIDFCVDNAKTD